MLELFGNPWVTGIAFVVGPLVLFLMVWRRRRPGGEGAKGGAVRGDGRRGPASSARETPKAGTARGSRTVPGMPELPSGFRDLAWGSAAPEGMVLVHEEAEQQICSRPSDELRVGNVAVGSIAYVYQARRLRAVLIELGASAFEPLVRHLTAEWGAPRRSVDQNRCAWVDARAGEEASQAVLERKPETRSARLVLSSKAMVLAQAAPPPR